MPNSSFFMIFFYMFFGQNFLFFHELFFDKTFFLPIKPQIRYKGISMKGTTSTLIACHKPIRFLVAACINRYVITLGLWNKYDVDGHYFRFAAQILAITSCFL